MNQIPFQDFEAAFRNRHPSVIGIQNEYAVLTPLVDVNGELHLLYEVRADHMRRQPGEVCFPGGKLETCESAEQCAVRETAEELSIPPSDIQIIGTIKGYLSCIPFWPSSPMKRYKK